MLSVSEETPQINRQNANEYGPNGERRQSTFGRDLHRHIVEMGIDLFYSSCVPIFRVAFLDHVRSDAHQRMSRDHAYAFTEHRETIQSRGVFPIEGGHQSLRD